MVLYAWQNECLKSWLSNGCKGIVNVVTGAGKTVLAVEAIRLLEAVCDDQIRVKIVVPKGFLVRQWFYVLMELLNISRDEIGIFSGTLKCDPNRKYMIYVINSARYSFARHILDSTEGSTLIIADECHHYGSEENSKIFDFADIMPKDHEYYALGLSATPYCKNFSEVLTRYLGKEIYRFDMVQALEAGIISRFSLFNISLEFTGYERMAYGEISDKLAAVLSKLKKCCPWINFKSGSSFFAKIENIAKTSKDPNVRELAKVASLLSYRRKEIVHEAAARIKCVLDLVRLIDNRSKIIIFGERIEMANQLYEKLIMLFPNKVGLYHSGVYKEAGKTVLRNFEDSEIRILVSCKTLDEGLNISDTDVGIVVSSTSSERQRIQRLGRVLRKKEGGRRSIFYYLFVKDTMEETEILSDLPDRLRETVNIINLDYDTDSGTFENWRYGMLSELAIKYAVNCLWDEAKIAELAKNIELGTIKSDWLAEESECVLKIQNASSKRERNYYVAMLFLIRANIKRLIYVTL